VPHGRTYNPGVIENIVHAGQQWGSPAVILNLEVEALTNMPPSRCKQTLVSAGWTGEYGVSTEAWLYDWPAVDWQPLVEPTSSALLQMYPEDAKRDPSEIPSWQASCVAHARDYGFRYVGVTFQAWRSDPDWFDRSTDYSIAYGDDIGPGNWAPWAPA
jgi:hypothetical protein